MEGVPNLLQQLRKKTYCPHWPWDFGQVSSSQGLSPHLYKENSDWDIQNLPDSQDCAFGANFMMLSQRWKDSGALLLLLSPFSGQSDQPEKVACRP